MPLYSNPLVIATLGGLAVGGAIAVHLVVSGEDDPTIQQAPVSEQPPPSDQMSSDEPPAQAAVTQQGSTETPAAALPEAQPAAPDDGVPSFDVVRITPEGNTVIAGRAPAGQTVEVFDGKTSLGLVKSDANGEWVFVPSDPLPVGNRELSLKATGPDGTVVQSDQIVMMVIPEPESDDEIFAVATARDGLTASEVLQRPSGSTHLVLTIETVDYDEQGELRMTGIAPAGTMVNVYLDNTYIGTAQSDADGVWHLIPETRVQTGVYQLRADQVDDKGKVLKRVSMPFMRDEPDTSVGSGDSYVVQPGNSLWRIARRAYGRGMEFTVIYKANIDQIGDPDLIYPGQIFSLPVPVSSSATAQE